MPALQVKNELSFGGRYGKPEREVGENPGRTSA
jgi:hypothetical protein